MSSGGDITVTGSYTGNGGSEDILVEDSVRKRPKKLRVISANGEAILHDGMEGALKIAGGANPAALAGLEFTDRGFKVSGTDAAVNAASVRYDWELV